MLWALMGVEVAEELTEVEEAFFLLTGLLAPNSVFRFLLAGLVGVFFAVLFFKLAGSEFT